MTDAEVQGNIIVTQLVLDAIIEGLDQEQAARTLNALRLRAQSSIDAARESDLNAVTGRMFKYYVQKIEEAAPQVTPWEYSD